MPRSSRNPPSSSLLQLLSSPLLVAAFSCRRSLFAVLRSDHVLHLRSALSKSLLPSALRRFALFRFGSRPISTQLCPTSSPFADLQQCSVLDLPLSALLQNTAWWQFFLPSLVPRSGRSASSAAALFSTSYEDKQDILLMRFADYFAHAFSSVNASQFPWAKMLKESTVEKMIDIPLCHISEAVYRTSVDWISQHSGEALAQFTLWCMHCRRFVVARSSFINHDSNLVFFCCFFLSRYVPRERGRTEEDTNCPSPLTLLLKKGHNLTFVRARLVLSFIENETACFGHMSICCGIHPLLLSRGLICPQPFAGLSWLQPHLLAFYGYSLICWSFMVTTLICWPFMASALICWSFMASAHICWPLWLQLLFAGLSDLIDRCNGFSSLFFRSFVACIYRILQSLFLLDHCLLATAVVRAKFLVSGRHLCSPPVILQPINAAT